MRAMTARNKPFGQEAHGLSGARAVAQDGILCHSPLNAIVGAITRRDFFAETSSERPLMLTQSRVADGV